MENFEHTFLKSANTTNSYADVDNFISFFSDFLRQNDLEGGQLIGILASSCDESVLIIAACWKLGIPFVCFRRDEQNQMLTKQIEALNPALIFTDDDRLTSESSIFIDIKKVSKKYWNAEKIVQLKNKKQYEEQIFAYFFTSGTTSKPKIVPLKRRQMITAAKASTQNIKAGKNDFWLLCMPLNHIGGVSIILRSLIYSSAIYRIDNFDPSISKLLANNSNIKVVSLVPTMLKRLLDKPHFQPHPELQILLGGGPVHLSLLKKAKEKNLNVITSYGMTETCAQIAATSLNNDLTGKPNVGTIFEPNELEIRDEENNKLETGQQGNIWLKGPQVFDGYYQTEKKNCFDEDGWFKTGDLGRIDENEQLFVAMRRTDLIITGGENVAPFEVEEALLDLEGIKEGAVIGLPDEEWGQIVAAVVVIDGHKKYLLMKLSSR